MDGQPSTAFQRALAGQRRSVVLASVLVTVHQIAEVLVPVTIGVIIDRAIVPGDADQAVQWLAVLAIQFGILSAAGCTAVYVDERAQRGATHWARLELARRVLDERGGVERALPGEVVSLSTVETTRIGDGVGAVIVGVGAIAGVLGGAAILFATSFWLGAAVVVGLPVVLLVVQVLAEPLVARVESHQEAVGVASGVAADLFRGLRVLKGLGADGAASARYRSASRAALTAGLDANRVRSTYSGLTVTIAGVFVVLVAWAGARLALDGTISVGELVAALGVTQFLVGPLGRLAFAGSELASARAAAGHLDAAFGAEPAVVGGSAVLPADAGGALSLEDVRFRSLQGVTFEVGAGELVGVVASPVDAAALVECLERGADPESGRVVLDGVDHATLVLDEARRAVVVGHHDAPLFGGTVRENVVAAFRAGAGRRGAGAGAGAGAGSAGDGDGNGNGNGNGNGGPGGVVRGAAGDDGGGAVGGGGLGALEAIVAAASLDDVLAAVTGGLDGELTEEGRSLSGGQRQRVALARALATDAHVLVLHEPTTAVDTATESRIAAGIRALRAGRTTLLLTTSPTLLAGVDRVVVVREGTVVAVGAHAQLATSDALYRQVVLR